jgi:hypothetical protein
MHITGAEIIHLQITNGVTVHPNFRVQGKANYKTILEFGATKGDRERSAISGKGPKSGTVFHNFMARASVGLKGGYTFKLRFSCKAENKLAIEEILGYNKAGERVM